MIIYLDIDSRNRLTSDRLMIMNIDEGLSTTAVNIYQRRWMPKIHWILHKTFAENSPPRVRA